MVQVGLSYTVMQVTSHRVCRLRNFLRWCCLFVLTVWLIVSIVVTNEHHLGHKSLGLESLRVLRVVCLLAEGATLLLFAVFLATFVHEFSNVTLQHFMVSSCSANFGLKLLWGQNTEYKNMIKRN